jgi:hypothetical protein
MMKIQQRGMDSEYPDAGGDNVDAVPEGGVAEGEVVSVSEVVDYDETNGDGAGEENADEDEDEEDADEDEDEADEDEDEEDADEEDADEEDADEDNDADEEDADEEDADEDNEDADEDITDGDEPDEEDNEGEQDDDAVALEILEEELDEIEELVDAEFNPESAITLNDDDAMKSTSHDDQLDQSTYEILANDDDVDTMELNHAGGNLSPTTEQNSKFIQTSFANNKSTYLLVAILLVCGIGLLTKLWAHRNTNKYDRRRRTKIAHKRLPTIDDDSV